MITKRYLFFMLIIGLVLFSCNKNDTPSAPEEIVDLGLSVKWRGWNLGASAPDEYGNMYAWGEEYSKNDFTETNYKHGNLDRNRIWKYCTQIIFWAGAGEMDRISTVEKEDDAASVILGGTWRMPTEEEFKELIQNCNWQWISYGNTQGYKVVSKVEGYTKKWIFFPADNPQYVHLGVDNGTGQYWSSTLGNSAYSKKGNDYTIRAIYLQLDRSTAELSMHGRWGGNFIRPVTP